MWCIQDLNGAVGCLAGPFSELPMAHCGGAALVLESDPPFMIGLGYAERTGGHVDGTRRPGFEGTRGHSKRAYPSRRMDAPRPWSAAGHDRLSDRPDLSPLGTQTHPRHGSGTLGRDDPGKVPQGAVSGRLMSFPLRKGSPIMRSECPRVGSLFFPIETMDGVELRIRRGLPEHCQRTCLSDTPSKKN